MCSSDLQDLQGPKIRLGRFKDGPITVAKGDAFTLTSRDVACTQEIATVTYDKLAEEVTPGSRILLDDGRVEMVADRVDKSDQTLYCTVTVGGVLSNNKGVNFPDVQLSIRALTDKDRTDLAFGLQQGVDWVALSFVRNPSDMQEIKELIGNSVEKVSNGTKLVDQAGKTMEEVVTSIKPSSEMRNSGITTSASSECCM